MHQVVLATVAYIFLVFLGTNNFVVKSVEGGRKKNCAQIFYGFNLILTKTDNVTLVGEDFCRAKYCNRFFDDASPIKNAVQLKCKAPQPWWTIDPLPAPLLVESSYTEILKQTFRSPLYLTENGQQGNFDTCQRAGGSCIADHWWQKGDTCYCTKRVVLMRVQKNGGADGLCTLGRVVNRLKGLEYWPGQAVTFFKGQESISCHHDGSCSCTDINNRGVSVNGYCDWDFDDIGDHQKKIDPDTSTP